MPISEVYNMDCMEYMKQFPDKHFELAIVDPPYGGEFNTSDSTHFGGIFDKYKYQRTGGPWNKKYYKDGTSKSKTIEWDHAPDQTYFNELFRVSQKIIIWGGNYFNLPPQPNFFIWRKLTISDSFSMAMAEYAWTNIKGTAKVFEKAPQDKNRFHPTQKPIDLYKWLIKLSADNGDKILDTHLGSGSSRIAAWDMGFDFYATELDKDYFDAMEARFKTHTAQGSLFEFSWGNIRDQ